MAKDDAPHSLMSPAEMKPLLMLSKRDPVSAVIGLTKSKDGVVFLAKKVKPRKLVAQMKKHAAEAKMELDVASLRFGRATVDAEADSSLVTFTVNKEAAGTMRPKLLVHLKKAGFGKCEIVVDASLETESDEDEFARAWHGPSGWASRSCRHVGRCPCWGGGRSRHIQPTVRSGSHGGQRSCWSAASRRCPGGRHAGVGRRCSCAGPCRANPAHHRPGQAHDGRHGRQPGGRRRDADCGAVGPSGIEVRRPGRRRRVGGRS